MRSRASPTRESTAHRARLRPRAWPCRHAVPRRRPRPPARERRYGRSFEGNGLDAALDQTLVAGQAGEPSRRIDAELSALLLGHVREVIGDRVHVVAAMAAEQAAIHRPRPPRPRTPSFSFLVSAGGAVGSFCPEADVAMRGPDAVAATVPAMNCLRDSDRVRGMWIPSSASPDSREIIMPERPEVGSGSSDIQFVTTFNVGL